ncbi:MAG TPA: hypothetical protein VMI54_02800 [Polyangiaceae bacterium]|nr:hypothetical protein [Polyangiaceae bacterium]
MTRSVAIGLIGGLGLVVSGVMGVISAVFSEQIHSLGLPGVLDDGPRLPLKPGQSAELEGFMRSAFLHAFSRGALATAAAVCLVALYLRLAAPKSSSAVRKPAPVWILQGVLFLETYALVQRFFWLTILDFAPREAHPTPLLPIATVDPAPLLHAAMLAAVVGCTATLARARWSREVLLLCLGVLCVHEAIPLGRYVLSYYRLHFTLREYDHFTELGSEGYPNWWALLLLASVAIPLRRSTSAYLRGEALPADAAEHQGG